MNISDAHALMSINAPLAAGARGAGLTSPGADPFLDAADRIGRRLCRDAIWSGSRCNWLGWSMEIHGNAIRAVHRAMPPWLYHGTAGIALFLGHLEKLTGDREQRQALRGAVRLLGSRLEELKAQPFGGLYVGLFGVGHALLTLGELGGEEAWIKDGLRAMDLGVAQEVGPEQLDYLNGVAGAIPVLLGVAARHGRPDLLEVARRYGDVLMHHAVTTAEGVSWPSAMASKNLTGFSHGTAGMACALLELHRVCPDERLLEAARGALAYERHLFNPAMGNWPDYRENPRAPSKDPAYPVTWCHGAGGIGVARVRILELLPDDPAVMGELDAALRAVCVSLQAPVTPGVTDFSLCHGVLGNAEMLLLVADALGREDIREGARTVGRLGVELYHRKGLPWPCGVMGAGETPGLLLGTAGIGTFYLRLHDTRAAPSPLLVRPAGADQGALQGEKEEV